MSDVNAQIQLKYVEKIRTYLSDYERKTGKRLTACVVTYGCQMNVKDSEKLAGILEDAGFNIIEDEDADLVIYNTCTVRENANKKLYGHLGLMKHKKEENKDKMIALCGCMMQEKGVIEILEKDYKFVDIIFGTHNIYKFAELLWERLSSGKHVLEILDKSDEIVEDLPSKRNDFFRCGVNIMYGCNNFCTFCIVPYVRGREKSRNPKDIVRECEALAKDGVVEVMLLGQNVNSYGKTLEDKMTFAELLSEIEKVEGIERIRFMTSHPKDLSDDLIKVMASSKKICKQLHLPLQSGSSALLKKMNRHYDKDRYLLLVDKLKKAIPDICLTTDIIVGFPGETEEDFLETLDVVKKCEYDSAYTFIYSKRTGTPAATFEDQVPKDVVKDRFDRLLKLVNEISSKKTKELEGKTVKVLVDEVNKDMEGFMSGRLDNNMVVHFKGDKDLLGKFVNVKLNEAKGFYYIGELA